MNVGSGRYRYTEKGKQDYWISTRYICIDCAIPRFGASPREFVSIEKDFRERGVKIRFLRPITPDDMKGEKIS